MRYVMFLVTGLTAFSATAFSDNKLPSAPEQQSTKEKVTASDTERVHMAAYGNSIPPYYLEQYDSLVGYNRQFLNAFYAGRYVEAELIAQDQVRLAIFHPDYANSVYELAHAYVAQGRSLDAIPLYAQVLTIYKNVARQLPSSDSQIPVALTLIGLAEAYSAEKRYLEAIQSYEEALAIFQRIPRSHPGYRAALTRMARVYLAQGRYVDANALCERALHASLSEVEEPSFTAQIRNTLGLAYQGQRRNAEALSQHERALAAYKMVFGAQSPNVAQTLNYMADAYVAQGKFTNALEQLRQAAPIVETLAQNDSRTRAGIGEEQIDQYGVFSDLVSVAFSAAMQQPDIRRALVDEAFVTAQRATQTAVGVALNQMAVRFANGKGDLSKLVREKQDLAAQAEMLDKTRLGLLSQTATQNNVTAAEKLLYQRDELARRIVAIGQLLETGFSNFAALARPTPLSSQDTQRLLTADEAMIVYLRGNPDTFAWVVTREGINWFRVDMSVSQILDAVTKLRGSLNIDDVLQALSEGKNANEVLFDIQIAHGLFKALIEPAQDLIKNKRKLIVVPSGVLTSLPFHLLVTEKPLKPATNPADYRSVAWLAKDYAVSVLPSVPSLKALRAIAKGAAGSKALTGYGDPVFRAGQQQIGKERGKLVISHQTRAYTAYFRGAQTDLDALRSGLPQLPETRDELSAIAKRLGVPQSEIHFGRTASEAAVKKARLDQYRIVYFATHGLVAGDIKTLAEPALALTLPTVATDLDDGLLTASEVAQLKLNADWVVLSACNTAAGDKPGAEALSGLARAFFYAGARALLVSHWPVGSDAATRLTTATFDALADEPSIGRSEALRRAMISMIDDKSSEWNGYPAFWAPFVVVGDGGAIAAGH